MHLDETWVNFNGPYKKIAEHIINSDLRRSTVFLPAVYLGQPTLSTSPRRGYRPFNNLLPFEDSSQDYFVCRDQFDSTTKLEAFYPRAENS